MHGRRVAVRWTATLAIGLLAVCVALATAESKKDAKAADAKSLDAKSADAKAPETKPATRPGVRPVPDRALAPGQVVRIVMDALQHNDAKDTGIAVTFDFASPGNKKMTGPLKRFIPMLKQPAYAPMLNHKSAKYGKVLVDDDHAAEVVTIVDAKGQQVSYAFELSKQQDGDLAGCWMTDGVIRIEPGQKDEAPKPDNARREDA